MELKKAIHSLVTESQTQTQTQTTTTMELKKTIDDLTVIVTPGTKLLILMLQELGDIMESIIEVHTTEDPHMSDQEVDEISNEVYKAFQNAQRYIEETIRERVMADITTLRGYTFEL